MAQTQNLSPGELERTVDFLLVRMDQRLRRELMAEQPVIYARLYPTVAPGVVTHAVAEAVARARREHRKAVADELDLVVPPRALAVVEETAS